ncbi:MAG TPA: uracil/xanthine transporter [Ktedonobacteraceae bacterium]|nr:uracil/xanthine transporter [Ktedonobacteraceae bacterium]
MRSLSERGISPIATGLAGLQWLFFMFANIVVIPLSIGYAFHQPPAVITASLERAFIYTGIACILQGTLGHRLPLMEGPAGLWWGVILSLAASAQAEGQSLAVLGGTLEVGIILTGLIIILLGVTGLQRWLRLLFTPLVTSTFYFLLGAQLCSIFFKGMIGLSSGTHIQPGIALLSLGLVVLVLLLSIFGRGLISNFAILTGIIVGWIAFVLLFPGNTAPLAPAGNVLFAILPWGPPSFNIGLLITIVLTGLISLSNTFAALEGAKTLFEQEVSNAQYRRSLVVTGFSSLVSGLFGIVPYAPYVSSFGFLRTTRILKRAPFLMGAALFILLGLIPALGQLFASLPVSVGDAVLFVAYLQLFGSGLSLLEGMKFTSKTIYRIALPVLLGLSLMLIPSTAFSTIPGLVRSLVQNGLVMGIIVAVVVEFAIPWQRIEHAA